MAIIRQIVLTAFLVLALWLGLDLTLNLFPVMRDRIDTGEGRGFRSLLSASQIAHVVGEFPLLARGDTPKLLLLGGSNAQFALLADQVAPLFPGYDVHNLTLNGVYGGASVRNATRLIEAAEEMIPPSAAGHTVAVYGLAPHTFVNEKPFSRISALDETRMKMFPRLYRETDGGTVMRHGREPTVAALRFIRPFLVVKRLVEVVEISGSVPAGWDWLTEYAVVGGIPAVGREADGGHAPSRDAALNAAVRDMFAEIGDFESSPKFQDLRRMLDYAATHGTRVVLVLTPLPPWLEEEYGQCEQFKAAVLSLAGSPEYAGKVFSVDMTGLLNDSGFNDSSHVKWGATPHCAYSLWSSWPLR